MDRCLTATATLVATALLLAAGAPRASAGAEPPVDLLRLPTARIEATSLPAGGAALAGLTDGDTAKAVEADASAQAPLDVVYGFAGADVAPEGVRVALPPGTAEAPPAARVEILVSTASAHAGFRSVRADPLAAGTGAKTLEFLPVAARWILVRLTPAPGAKRLAVAEVSVLGRPGPPESRYAFAESPAKAFDVLRGLAGASALQVDVTADEKALFARAAAGRLDAKGFLEAALLASGVTDAAKRAEYAQRVQRLEQEARAALGDARGSALGDALLRWMHRGPLAKGYVGNQTDLSTLLDTGTFNCVSSAVLYVALARRLGLDARAVEVPSHAFAVVYDGTSHADVETTTPDGFDPARDPSVVARFEAQTGFRYIPDSHRDQRREVEEAGLAAIVYYNHGVMLLAEKRWHEALLANFRAMSLDPEFDSAVKNALSVLARWGVDLAEAGKPEAALDVIGTGLALAPKDATLVNNRLWVWQRWAEREIDAGRPDEALAILARAAQAAPDGGFAERRAWVYLKRAEALADAKRWTEALAAAEPGLAKLEGKPRQDLARWKSGLWSRWFADEVHARRFEEAARVLEQGLSALADDPGLAQNAGYLAQEWGRAAAEKGRAQGLEVVRALVRRFPGRAGVLDSAENHVRRQVREAVDGKRWTDALAVLDEGQDLLPDEKARQELGVFAFDRWAKDRMQAGKWAEAADVYVQARARHPASSVIAQNIAFLAQEWSRAALAQGGAEEARRVGEVLKEKFPDVERASKGSANALRLQVQELVRARKHQDALKALEEGRTLLEGERDAEDIWLAVYDSWANDAVSGGRFAEAADAYAAALARLPGHKHVVNNLGWLAQKWGESVGARDPAGAVEALRGLVRRFPEVPDVSKAAAGHVRRTVQRRAEKEPEAALADLESWKDLLPEADAATASADVFDRWARRLAGEKRWQEAVDVYAKARERHPEHRRLQSNETATWDEWAKSFTAQKKWDEALAVYAKALERLPGTRLLEQNKKWSEEQKAKR